MVHVQFTLEVERNKVNELMDFFGREIYPENARDIASLGGKFLGMWSTVWGNRHEIIIMVAFPSEETYSKVGAHPTEPYRKALEKWMEATPRANVKVLRPAPWSPLQ
ncbi:MAG: hypothetical protein PHR56_07870 [Dehalococcoidales bacterium]|nr:hypothetical protein [Dehalococcoidales bacterium]